MTAPRELAKPPITEALVDIRTISEQPIDLVRLAPLRDALRETFPKVDERHQIHGEFRYEAGKLLPPTARDLGFHGLWLQTEDGSRIAQFRVDGFTFNNVGLGFYMGGEALIEEALRLWALYAEVATPSGVMRIALRYLNRLDLPLHEGDEFKTYLTSPPELPEEAPQKVSSFLSRIVAHDDTGAMVVVTQKLDAGTDPTPVLIDLDVSFSRELEPTAEALRPHFDMLRGLKNRTFFSLITPETVKLYL